MAVGRVVVDAGIGYGTADEVCIGSVIVATAPFTFEADDPRRDVLDGNPTSFVRLYADVNL